MNFRVTAVCVIQRGDQILLGEKFPNVGPYPNAWGLPGGGINLGEETAEKAVMREVREETGLEIQNLQAVAFDEDDEPDKHGEMTRYIFLQYTADYLSGDLKANDDMNNCRWIEKKDFTKLNLNKPTKKLFKKLGLL